MTTLEQITIRKVRLEASDYEGIAQVVQSANAADDISARPSAREFQNQLTAPGFDPDDAFVVEHESQLVAFSEFSFEGDGNPIWASAAVLPMLRESGIAQRLLTTVDESAVARATATFSEAMPIIIHRNASAPNLGGIALLKANGYTHSRTFYEMQIDLTQPLPPPPPLPEGLRLVPVDGVTQGYALYEADETAFADHWGHSPVAWEWFEHSVLNNERSDLRLWVVAWAGDQIAGYSYNRPLNKGDLSVAWVGHIGVLEGWRRQGLGTTLLAHDFARFQEFGYQQARLMVDSDNATNALGLYERAGMHVVRSSHVYRKQFR